MMAVFCNQCYREWLETFHPDRHTIPNAEKVATGIYFVPGHYRVCSHRLTEKRTVVGRSIHSLLRKIGLVEKAVEYGAA